MNEPVYTFVKGQGWVPYSHEAITAYTSDGKRVLIELRPPKEGEFGGHTSTAEKTAEWWVRWMGETPSRWLKDYVTTGTVNERFHWAVFRIIDE